MRELVTLQVGQAGNQVATSFWERILAEHGLDEDGHIKPNVDHVCTDRLDVFFSEAGESVFLPSSGLNCTNVLSASPFAPQRGLPSPCPHLR